MIPCGRAIVVVTLALLLSGCASYRSTVDHLRLTSEAGHFDEALTTLSSSSLAHRDKDRFLFLAEKGMLLHLAGNYAESNDAFDAAEQRADELFGISVSNELKGMVINDTQTEYGGEDFERVQINYFRALNYLALNDLEGALVECRKVDHLLSVISDRYEGKNIYREDPLARYLSAILYEASNDQNNAFIDYRKAYELYRDDERHLYGVSIPPPLLDDLLRSAVAAGLRDEALEYRQLFNRKEEKRAPGVTNDGELVVIINNGWVPRKVRKNIFVPVPSPPHLPPVKISIPEMQGPPPLVDHVEGVVDGKALASSQRIEQIASVAINNLQDRIGRIVVKTVARIVAKQIALEAAVHAVDNKKGGGAALLTRTILQIGVNLSEQADIRSWTTLPYEAQFLRIPLPAGVHQVELRLLDSTGTELERRQLPEVNIAPRKKTFRIIRSFR
ncbi:MAG TPA: hypothetical protein VFR01_05495 [Geobacterales bacterium]|nr:hypothetical protein [Geobacterales bacterium]